MRPQFHELQVHCVVCTEPVPPERLKYKAITCSEEHARLRKLSMRAKQDSRECRFCRKPTTPAEKAAYQRFRKWELEYPFLAYPAQFKRWKANSDALVGEENVDLTLFTLAIAQRMAEEDEDAKQARLAAAAADVPPPSTVGHIGEAGPELRDS